ncbi:conserved protein of unknown function [Petrocella atlantisensis]|uniref:DUF4391 domain-containing protein n=1 Tax=Petrocella atlantisensis TaxID=2173034 RepID=A0A3P7P1B1_9FIRM|nr:DUF4391 domain-containing protein [Petrocella atlantisensis]VDN47270.1 conserved protein of unknown function [Petrocella atlantisensis]
MFNIPESYRVDKRIPLKDLIPKELKPNEKRNIKAAIKKATLRYQISGEEISSVNDDVYRYQVIQYYDFELEDIKKAGYIAKVYQELIKSPCIIRLFDSTKEVYCFALKRLNQINSSEVVISDILITEPYQLMLPDMQKKQFYEILHYENVINKESKVTFYQEIYVKAYILINKNLHKNIIDFLDKPIWYDSNKIIKLYSLVKEIKLNDEKLNKTATNAEKMKINQSIRNNFDALEKI